MTEKSDAREILGISPSAKVALVLYESETEHEFCVSLHSLVQQYNSVIVLPVTSTARRQLYLTCKDAIQVLGLIVIDDIGIETVADEIIAFRYNELLFNGRKVPVRIIDTKNRWLTTELTK